jgi:hypothetical protein
MKLTIDPPAFVMFSVTMKIPQIIRNVKMFNQKTVDRQNISRISHPDELEKKKHFIPVK